MRPSSIRIALDIIADYWTILILRELFMGASQWSELENRLRIPPSTLNKRLKNLVSAGCLVKVRDPGRREQRYELTPMGRDLFPIVMAAREWQLQWDTRPDVFVTPWVHSCGQPARCQHVCNVCRQPVTTGGVRLIDSGATLAPYTAPPARHQRGSGASDARAASNAVPKVIELIGNRRSSLVMSAVIRGHRRFDDIVRFCKLAPATVSERLKRLQLLGILHSRLYQRRPDRYEYFPSDSGADLTGISLQLLGWANSWLTDRGAGATVAIHKHCGHEMASQLVCASCGGDITLDSCRLDDRQLDAMQAETEATGQAVPAADKRTELTAEG